MPLGLNQSVQGRAWAAAEIKPGLPGGKPGQQRTAQAGKKPLISRISRVIDMKIVLFFFIGQGQIILPGNGDEAAIGAGQIDPVVIFKILGKICPAAQGALII